MSVLAKWSINITTQCALGKESATLPSTLEYSYGRRIYILGIIVRTNACPGMIGTPSVVEKFN